MIKKVFFLLALCAFTLTSFAESTAADWYLYLYSSTKGYIDNPQFWTTDDGNIFTMKNYELTEQGINFSVHNNAWSLQYGWGTENVTTTGKAYKLAASTSATGWLALPTGLYNITFDAENLTIQFDTPVVTKTGATTQNGITYDLYDNLEAVVTDNTNDKYLRGGDVSMLNYVESFGAKFYNTDADSTKMDALKIMKLNGCNVVRLRLYNNPGTAVTTSDGTYRIPEGYLDSTDVLNLAKRAKKLGMKIVLTLYYSDFWADALKQIKPTDWQGYSLDELKTAVYNFTYNFLQKMKDQDTAPDYVAIGNEIRSGILFGLSSSKDAVNGSTESGNLAALLSQGSAAVRAACQDAKIILHLPYDSNFKEGNYTSFIQNYANGVDYDVIGASYYPYYTNATPTTILPSLANTMYNTFSKPLMVMETGYSWTQYRPSGRNGGNYEGQLHMNGSAYNEASEAGQKSFIQELQTVIKNNSHILGYLYWDPIMVDQSQTDGTYTWWIKTCWAEKYDTSASAWYENGNQVSNTALFDYTGHSLKVFEAINEDAPSAPTSIDVDGTTYTVIGKTSESTAINSVNANNREPLTLNPEQAYNALGQRVNANAKGLIIVNGKKIMK